MSIACAARLTLPGRLLCCTPSAAPVTCSASAKNLLRPNNQPSNHPATSQKRPAKSTMFSSVRSRLTIWYATVLTCTLLFLSLVIYFIVKQSVLARTSPGLVNFSFFFPAPRKAELTDPPKAEGFPPAARQSMLEH